MGEIQIREVLPGEYEDTGSLTQRAYVEYARPGDPLWEDYFGMLADVAGRAGFATVLVAVSGGRIVGTATVELDRTIEGTEDLQPGQANLRLLAVDPRARQGGVDGGWCRRASRSPGEPGRRSPRCTPPSRWWPRSVSTDLWASSAILLATLRCTPIWSCKPSGFGSGHWTGRLCITPGIRDLTGTGQPGRYQPAHDCDRDICDDFSPHQSTRKAVRAIVANVCLGSSASTVRRTAPVLAGGAPALLNFYYHY